jgi:hypothetical protein
VRASWLSPQAGREQDWGRGCHRPGKQPQARQWPHHPAVSHGMPALAALTCQHGGFMSLPWGTWWWCLGACVPVLFVPVVSLQNVSCAMCRPPAPPPPPPLPPPLPLPRPHRRFCPSAHSPHHPAGWVCAPLGIVACQSSQVPWSIFPISRLCCTALPWPTTRCLSRMPHPAFAYIVVYCQCYTPPSVVRAKSAFCDWSAAWA